MEREEHEVTDTGRELKRAIEAGRKLLKTVRSTARGKGDRERIAIGVRRTFKNVKAYTLMLALQ